MSEKEMPNGLDVKTIKGMDQESMIYVLVDYIAALGGQVKELNEKLDAEEDQRQSDRADKDTVCKQQQETCDQRIRALESFRWKALGIIGGLAFLGTWLGPMIGQIISSLAQGG